MAQETTSNKPSSEVSSIKILTTLVELIHQQHPTYSLTQLLEECDKYLCRLLIKIQEESSALEAEDINLICNCFISISQCIHSTSEKSFHKESSIRLVVDKPQFLKALVEKRLSFY